MFRSAPTSIKSLRKLFCIIQIKSANKLEEGEKREGWTQNGTLPFFIGLVFYPFYQHWKKKDSYVDTRVRDPMNNRAAEMVRINHVAVAGVICEKKLFWRHPHLGKQAPWKKIARLLFTLQ